MTFFGSSLFKVSPVKLGQELVTPFLFPLLGAMLAEDLAHHAGKYRLYVFLNQFTSEPALCQAVKKLYAQGATVLWLYAPGWSEGNSLADMKTLTGLEFANAGSGVAVVKMREDGRAMGMPRVKVAERFSPVGADQVLGVYDDGKPGLAEKRVGKGMAVFSGTWQLDWPFLKELVRKSGAHVWCEDDDPVEANGSLFLLHARKAGEKRVRLPRRVTAVTDVFTGRIIARNTDTFTFDAGRHSSHLFYFGPNAEVLSDRLSKGGQRE